MEDLFAEDRKNLPQRLDHISLKLSKVLKENRTLRAERSQLQEERRTLRQTIDRQREDSLALQKQIKSSVIAVSMTAGKDEVAALRDQIDAYVAELDRAIATLQTAN